MTQPLTRTIDLRSDTVSVPTPAMLDAMMHAEVGDDVFGEDPTVNRLEAHVADLLGKEAALLVTSGTMGNLIGVMAQTRPGDEVLMEGESHCYFYEGGGYASLAGVGVRFLPGERGILDPAAVAGGVQADNVHFPRTRLLVLENTHNRGGGSVYPVETVAALGRTCRELGLRLHMDGARLWHACVVENAEPVDYTQHVDTVTVCLSKGLGCPAGSLLAGSEEFIHEARRIRKRLGGGMRQAGYLAAAGLYALDNHRARLAQDHEHARMLADAVRECAQLRLVYDPPATNMVYFDVLPPLDPDRFAQALEERGVRILPMDPGRFRAVPHVNITREDILAACEALDATCARW